MLVGATDQMTDKAKLLILKENAVGWSWSGRLIYKYIRPTNKNDHPLRLLGRLRDQRGEGHLGEGDSSRSKVRGELFQLTHLTCHPS